MPARKLAEVLAEDDRAIEMLLYIAKQSADDPDFGAVKLQKIAFAADFGSYRRTGSSVSGQQYRRLGMGPVMADFKRIFAYMNVRGWAYIKKHKVGNRTQDRLSASVRSPQPKLLTDMDKKSIDDAIALLKGMNAGAVSAWSHQFPCWDYASDKEAIPYAASLLSNRSLTRAEYTYGHEAALAAGL